MQDTGLRAPVIAVWPEKSDVRVALLPDSVSLATTDGEIRV